MLPTSYTVSSHANVLHSAKRLSHFFSSFKAEGGITLLTGAGVSTDSGLQDYRGVKGAYVVTPGFKPITYQELISSLDRRKKYWARSFFGYEKFSRATPNDSHIAIAELESLSYVKHILTQNVDGLHQKAGSKKVTELHGSLRTVSCITCKFTIERSQFQREIECLNPLWSQHLFDHLRSGRKGFKLTPDGDIQLPSNTPYHDFNVPSCPRCQGVLKPDVVFFGENMLPKVRSECHDIVENSSALLVVGSSLAIPSAYRLFLKAAQSNKPAIILNMGKTRAGEEATFTINEPCTPIIISTLKNLKDTA